MTAAVAWESLMLSVGSIPIGERGFESLPPSTPIQEDR
jgi:hypothetical protein